MAEYKLEQGAPLPRPNARAQDRKAARTEAITLKVGARLASAS
jgi:hypothetical protein